MDKIESGTYLLYDGTCGTDGMLTLAEKILKQLAREAGIEAFIRREVLPYASDAWLDDASTKVGYEISFTRHLYKSQPQCSLD